MFISAAFLDAMCAGISPPDLPSALISVLKSVIPLNSIAPSIVFKPWIGLGLIKPKTSPK